MDPDLPATKSQPDMTGKHISHVSLCFYLYRFKIKPSPICPKCLAEQVLAHLNATAVHKIEYTRTITLISNLTSKRYSNDHSAKMGVAVDHAG